MRKQLLTLTLALICSAGVAQKLQKPVVDKITGETSIATTSEKIFAKASFSGTVGEQVFSTLVKAKDKYFLVLGIQTGKTSIFSIDEEQKAFVKLQDGSVLTLNSLTNDLAKYSQLSYGSNGRAVYELTKDDVLKLSQNPVTFIRVEYSGGTFEYDIKPKNAEVLKKQSELIKS